MAEKKTILIGEDDPAIIEVIKIILEEAGYHPVGITQASEIFSSVQKYQPALIFLDIWLSGEDGRVIAKKLKKHAVFSKTPIIMISANHDTEKIAKSIGADGFLSKPFTMEELLGTVEAHLK